MGCHGTDVDFDSLNGIQHQLAQFFIEQVETECVVECCIRKEIVLSKRFVGDPTQQNVLLVISDEFTRWKPVAAQSVVTHLSEFTFRTNFVREGHAALIQQRYEVFISPKWLWRRELTQLPCSINKKAQT